MNARVVAVLASALVTCVGVTDERARRDEDVGKGSIAAATFVSPTGPIAATTGISRTAGTGGNGM